MFCRTNKEKTFFWAFLIHSVDAQNKTRKNIVIFARRAGAPFCSSLNGSAMDLLCDEILLRLPAECLLRSPYLVGVLSPALPGDKAVTYDDADHSSPAFSSGAFNLIGFGPADEDGRLHGDIPSWSLAPSASACSTFGVDWCPGSLTRSRPFDMLP
jgi:hypothetical protein